MSTLEVILGHVFCAVGSVVIVFLGLWAICWVLASIWEKLNDVHIIEWEKTICENRRLRSNLDDMHDLGNQWEEVESANSALRYHLDKVKSERDHYKELVKDQKEVIDCQLRELNKYKIMEEASK